MRLLLAALLAALACGVRDAAAAWESFLSVQHAAADAGTPTIPALAASDKDLSTLVTALKTAHLIDTLAGKGPFTVFAPTNEAFAKLSAVTLKSLLEPKNIGKLTSILTYHVVSGRVRAGDLHDGQMVRTLEGAKLRVSVREDGVFIDGAKVTTADADAINGVVHIIDEVLLPPAADRMDDLFPGAQAQRTNEEVFNYIESILAATTATNSLALGSRCKGDPSRDRAYQKAFSECLPKCNAAQGWDSGVNPRCFQCCHDNYCFGKGSPTDLKCGCNGFDCKRRSHRSAGCDTCGSRNLRQ